MASVPSLVLEEQLLCPICLGLFVRPVSTPCGHNFCMTCLSSYWDQSPVTVCPVCKESYSQRPQLRVNTFISGLTQSFSSLQLTEEPQTQELQTGVLCDVCTAPQQGALKSCVECLTSFCSLHLEPHHRAPGLRRHTLVSPDAGLQSRVCPEHQQLLQSYCSEEKVLMCASCEGAHHKHRTLPLKTAYREMRSELDSTEAEITVMILEKVQRVRSIREAAAQRQEETRQEIAHSERVLQELLSNIQRSHKELVLKLEKKQQQADSEAEALAQEIELKILDLWEAQTKLQELKQTEDPVKFIQNLPHMSLQQSRAQPPLSLREEKLKERETLKICTSRLQDFLKKLDREIRLFSDEKWLALRRVQQFAVDLKLDPETAHPKLHLSQDLKQVRFNPRGRLAPESDNSRRFLGSYDILTDRGFSSGRFYFEVFVGQKDEWVLGVAKESVPKVKSIPRRKGCGVWALYFEVDEFTLFNCPEVTVHNGKVERVGVFVDYDKGLVSFFDVKTATCIHSFTRCVFN
ncbi:hypothetical protein NL108_015424 [Boleophthalmus pectinirostris]|uniref:E3 ubiquitin-protein ligase TRIM7-like n=1 Tax=Boleophthalmus pectinirostris TaxID=150288 RepID=UPI0024323E42|nr:E3 ubiquitin-protein ligase TRIM7-like [Boleophthalmus pectinirostris]KAJ0060545.1 hypothetical protein NL108_015424 [Boleophthalmus pectinirostris]